MVRAMAVIQLFNIDSQQIPYFYVFKWYVYPFIECFLFCFCFFEFNKKIAFIPLLVDTELG